jgi:beta-1,2-xylosyltransferase
MSADLDWRNAHRIRLHNFANNDSTAPTSFIAPDFSLSQAGSIPPPNTDSQRVMSSSQERTEMTMETIPTEEASRFFYDMALAGEPIQCMEEDGTCDQLRYVAYSSLGRD